MEPLWDLVIRARRVNAMLPLLEATLDAFVGIGRSSRVAPQPTQGAPQQRQEPDPADSGVEAQQRVNRITGLH